MKHLRHFIPLLGALALIALFLLLPEAPGAGCPTCSSNSPYVPLLGAGYFSLLTAVSLLFPLFPTKSIARGGLTWSILLALSLTYLHLPGWCPLCVVAHVSHILIWTIWAVVPAEKKETAAWGFKERLCVAAFAPFSVVALFSCLNLTFMAYGFKLKHPAMEAGLKIGDQAPAFAVQNIKGIEIRNADEKFVINFVSSGCPYCKEQFAILKTFAGRENVRMINVSSAPFPEWAQGSSAMEWVEDNDGSLRQLFKVTGYPTLFVIGEDGKITQVIAGVPAQLRSDIAASLEN
ncbi:MAG: TlpA family protein disulfide reductase [Verrucomicrobia bacterium]|nr:TlpA family protein disulfide reductase [Verrucomicrobiota bacterium]